MAPASVTHWLLKVIFRGLCRRVSWLCVAVVGDWTLSFLDMEGIALNTAISIQERMVPSWHGCCWQDPFQRIRHLGQLGQTKGMRAATKQTPLHQIQGFLAVWDPRPLIPVNLCPNFTHALMNSKSVVSLFKRRFPPHQHLALNFLSHHDCTSLELMTIPVIWTHSSACLWVALCILLLPTAGQEFALACCLDM